MGYEDNGTAALLLGRWRLLKADRTLDFAPDVRMEFQRGGRLTYEFAVGRQRQAIALVYRIEGDMLRTDHPATAHERCTRFWFGQGGVLVFDFAGACAWFVREW